MKNMLVTILIILFIGFSAVLLFFFDVDYKAKDTYDLNIFTNLKLFEFEALDKNNNGEDLLIALFGTDERNTEKSRSDVIMLIKYIANENKAIVVSIPRDCKVSIPGKGINKINAAYAYGGAELQVKVLEELFNITDIKYLHVNFKGFTKIVDILGGVEIYAEKDFKRDWGARDTYAKKGKNILFGADLLEYVRFRHDLDGDFGRIERQQEVMSSIVSSMLKPNNIVKLPSIALNIVKNIDSDMNIFFVMSNIESLMKLDSVDFDFYTLSTHSEKKNGIWYEIIDEEDLKHISTLFK